MQNLGTQNCMNNIAERYIPDRQKKSSERRKNIINSWWKRKCPIWGKLINGNRNKWPYRLFEKVYTKYNKMQKEHEKRGEWKDSWRVEINPEHRTEGFCFHLVGCPIAKHAKEHGYGELLPYLCKTDHFLAEVMHARLIRTQTEALGGEYCDYWYVGDESPVLKEYQNVKQI